jgi:hypothetical protein
MDWKSILESYSITGASPTIESTQTEAGLIQGSYNDGTFMFSFHVFNHPDVSITEIELETESNILLFGYEQEGLELKFNGILQSDCYFIELTSINRVDISILDKELMQEAVNHIKMIILQKHALRLPLLMNAIPIVLGKIDDLIL